MKILQKYFSKLCIISNCNFQNCIFQNCIFQNWGYTSSKLCKVIHYNSSLAERRCWGAIKILQHYWQLLERGKFFIVSAAQLLPPTHPPYFAVFLSVANCQLSIRGALVEKSQFLKGFFFKVSPFQGSSLLCLQLVANNLSCASLSRFFRLVFTS